MARAKKFYLSERVVYKKKFYEFTIDCNSDEMLNDNVDFEFTLVHYVYKNLSDKMNYFSDSGESSFKKKSKTKITKAGKTIVFEAERIAINLPDNFFPEKLKLLISEDAELLSFELDSGKTINMHHEESKGNTDEKYFLPTACTRAKKLPDDCYELSTLRNFRDNFLVKKY